MGKMPLIRDLRLSRSLPAAEIVARVQEIYPRFDKPLLSKCEHPSDYGIALLPSAFKAARALAPDWKPNERSGDRHKFHCSIRCRMDDETYRLLLAQIHRDGFRTAQDWMLDQVKAYISARCE
ncbi:MAG: hypothetical protein IJ418_02375 [Clostridia bacterium]|nr:hypothetical protein [Clostridia bacterium]